MSSRYDSLDRLAVNTIRTLSIDMIQKANSGHPGLPLGAAPMAYVLWTRHLRHNPKDPDWPDRDRFILSPGHGSALLYCLLYLSGYGISFEEMNRFRQWNSITPGHPESFTTPGVEATTGPLGQGTANAVGMAIAERFHAHRFNMPDHSIVDHYTYALVSDGDLMEGVSAEAGSLAGHLKLGKIICLYDSNDISLDGPTSLTFSTENVLARYESYGWHTRLVKNGDTDLDDIDRAIEEAKSVTDRPSIIEVKTTIGYGSPGKSGSASSHGAPLGDEEIRLTKKQLGWDRPDETFHVPDEVRDHFQKFADKGKDQLVEWLNKFESWSQEYPDLAAQWRKAINLELPDGWDEDLPSWIRVKNSPHVSPAAPP